MAQLRTQELRALGNRHQEAHDPVIRRDPPAALEDRLAQHRGPLHFEQEREARSRVPEAIDQLHGVGAGPAEEGEAGTTLVGGQAGRQQPAGSPAALLPRCDGHVQPQPVADVGQQGDRRRVLLGPVLEVVDRGQPWLPNAAPDLPRYR